MWYFFVFLQESVLCLANNRKSLWCPICCYNEAFFKRSRTNQHESFLRPWGCSNRSIKKKKRFIYIIEREGGRAEEVGGGRVRWRESQTDSLLSTEPVVGLDPMTLRSWPEQKSRVIPPTNQATQEPHNRSIFIFLNIHTIWIFCLSSFPIFGPGQCIGATPYTNGFLS